MKPKFTIIGFIALLVCVVGLVFLAPPAVRAQAQENIANLSANQPQGNVASVATDDDPSSTMPTAADDNNDPPSRVARLSFVEGSVSLQPGGTGEWGNAAKNRPMTIGDKLWTDRDSRAELQAGQVAIHLGDMTALSFLNLDQNVTQIRLAEGKLNFRVREIRQGENYEVDTPNLAFTVREAGAFRIDVNENGDFSSVTIVRGQGEVSAGGQTYTLHAGERADITGTDNNVQYSAGTAGEPDGLDRWAQERDVREDNSASAKHVSRDVVGYSDLDDNGTWKEEPEYGSVWVPNNVPPDWAPYSTGSWSYVGPWGWTWVDTAPWGFAPFHYGRWNNFGGYWGWCPGPIYASAFYAPAFVGFLGGGFGFGFGLGFGIGAGIGWFPLGWGEPFHPWYHAGPGYWHNVNVYNTHFNNVNRVYANNFHNFSNYRYAHNPGAVSAMSRNGFAGGQAVNRGAAHLTAANLRGAQVTHGAINASPTRASYFGASNMHNNISRPSSSVQNRMSTSNTSARNNSSFGAGAANRPNGTSQQGFSGNRNTSQGFPANRQSQLSANRPPSTMGSRSSASINSANSARPNTGNSGRSWNAQGNTTDSGRGPQGFGSSNSNRPTNNIRSARPSGGANSTSRPPWAGNGGNYGGGSSRYTSNRSGSSYGNSGGNRSYSPPSYGGRGNSSGSSYGGNRGYSSAPSYGGSRGYSAPRSYSSAPSYGGSRGYSGGGYSAPRSYGGGGSSRGSYGGSSGGSSHGGGGGGGSHGGGGGGSHGGGGHH